MENIYPCIIYCPGEDGDRGGEQGVGPGGRRRISQRTQGMHTGT